MKKPIIRIAGIGSRDIVDNQQHLDLLTFVIDLIEKSREPIIQVSSGSAPGTDSIFEQIYLSRGRHNDFISYLPSNGFEGRWVDNRVYKIPNHEKCAYYTETFHPNKSLKPYVKKLMNRNACQVLGDNLDTKADGIVAYSPGGSKTGGTSQALRIALHFEIPILNLYDIFITTQDKDEITNIVNTFIDNISGGI